MSDQQVAPPALSKTHDAEELRLLDLIESGPAKDVASNVKALRDFLGVRYNGENGLRTRILAYEQTTREQESKLGELEQKAGIKK